MGGAGREGGLCNWINGYVGSARQWKLCHGQEEGGKCGRDTKSEKRCRILSLLSMRERAYACVSVSVCVWVCVCVCKQLCVIGNRKWKRPSLERGCRPCRATFSTFSTRNELKIDLLLQRRRSTEGSSSNSSKSRRSTLRAATAAVTGAALGV